MAVILGSAIGKQLCDVLGLDAEKVESLRIDVAANELVRVSVTQSMYIDEVKEIIQILSNYNLVIAEDESCSTPTN